MAAIKLVYLDDTNDGDVTQVDPTADTFTIAGITMNGAITMGSHKITGLTAGTTTGDAVEYDQMNTAIVVAAAGFQMKASVRLATAAALPACTAAGSGVGKTLTGNSNGALSVDSVSTASGNRILVKDQSTGANNGIYVVTTVGDGSNPFVLTRATDADSSAEVKSGMYCFVDEGTVNDNTGWALGTNDTITLDTTALSFYQFSSAGNFTADQGLSYGSGSLKVELNTSADAASAGAGGGSSGLEFDANTGSGKLQAAISVAGGLQRASDGLSTLLKNATIASDSSGLSVTYAPARKDVIAVSEAVTAGDPLYWSSTANQLGKALASNKTKARVVAVAQTTQGTPGSNTTAVFSGPCTGVLSSATPGTPYFLGGSGGLTSTFVTTAGYVNVLCGYARNTTDLDVQIANRGVRGA